MDEHYFKPAKWRYIASFAVVLVLHFADLLWFLFQIYLRKPVKQSCRLTFYATLCVRIIELLFQIMFDTFQIRCQ